MYIYTLQRYEALVSSTIQASPSDQVKGPREVRVCSLCAETSDWDRAAGPYYPRIAGRDSSDIDVHRFDNIQS